MSLKNMLIISLVLVAIFSLVVLAKRPKAKLYPLNQNDTDRQWKAFKKNQNKSYRNSSHEAKRFFKSFYIELNL